MSSDFEFAGVSATSDADASLDLLPLHRLAFADQPTEQNFLRYRARDRRGYVAGLEVVSFLYVFGGFFIDVDPSPATTAIGFAIGFVIVTAAVVGMWFILTKPPTTIDAQTRRETVYSVVGSYQYVVAVLACAITPLAMEGACRVYGEENGDGKCHYFGAYQPAMMVTFKSYILRARATTMLPWSAAMVAATMVAFSFTHVPSALDYVLLAALATATVVGANIANIGFELADRRSFLAVVHTRRAERDLALAAAGMRNVIVAAMPAGLIDLETGALHTSAHQSDAATVGIADVHDFDRWSCGVLVNEVVFALHFLLTLFDVGAEQFRVVRAMAFGDCYVVVSGLVEPCTEHAQRVEDFANWQVRQVKAEGARKNDSAFGVRCSVCTGAAVGGVTGADSLRYSIAGAAYVAARRLLATAEIHEVVGDATGDDDDEDGTVTKTAEPVVVVADVRDGGSSVVTAPREFSDFGFNGCTLALDAPEDAEGMARFAAARQRELAHYTLAAPAALFATLFVVAVVERAPHRPATTARQLIIDASGVPPEVPMALLFVAAAAASSQLVLNWRRVETGLAASYVVLGVGLAAGVAALLLSPSRFVVAPVTLMLFLGHPGLFARLPWPAQLLLTLLLFVLPGAVWMLDHTPWLLPREGVILPCMLITFKYLSNRTLRTQFIVAAVAEDVQRVTVARTAQHRQLVEGLLPSHAAAIAVTRQLNDERYMSEWCGLSVLQLELALGGSAAFEAIAGAWAGIAPAVAGCGAGLLELTQSLGDSLTAAGPFSFEPESQARYDAVRLETSRRTVALVREVAALLRGHCAFTAVAACGNAFGSLIGANFLSFRMFGAVVREGNALLAAAPRVPGVTTAFAADSFRQRHRNFARPTVATADAAMSMARGGSVLGGTADPTMITEDSEFSAAGLWRARGVGVVSVSRIKMDSDMGVSDV
jgi:class 3 adenylate cyclase